MQTLLHPDFIIQYHLVDGDIEFIISNIDILDKQKYIGSIDASYIQNTDFFKSIEKLYDTLGKKEAILIDIQTQENSDILLTIKIDIRIHVEIFNVKCVKQNTPEQLTRSDLKDYVIKLNELTKQNNSMKDQIQQLQFELNCLREHCMLNYYQKEIKYDLRNIDYGPCKAIVDKGLQSNNIQSVFKVLCCIIGTEEELKSFKTDNKIQKINIYAILPIFRDRVIQKCGFNPPPNGWVEYERKWPVDIPIMFELFEKIGVIATKIYNNPECNLPDKSLHPNFVPSQEHLNNIWVEYFETNDRYIYLYDISNMRNKMISKFNKSSNIYHSKVCDRMVDVSLQKPLYYMKVND